jgi:anaerobic dimethyl sulfoxide reductase subunit C
MHDNEWTLVTFTILTQMVVGAFITLQAIAVLAADKYDAQLVNDLLNPMLPLLLIFLGIGTIAATVHLGNPQRAFNVIFNVKSSWLSREMLLGALFGLLLTLYSVVQLFTDNSPSVLALIVIVAGLLLIYAMSQLYMIRTVPAWNTPSTPATFFITSLMLGAIIVGMMLPAIAVDNPEMGILADDCLRWISPAIIILAVLQIVVIVLHTAKLATQYGAAAESLQQMLNKGNRPPFVMRLVYTALGVALLTIFIYNDGQGTIEYGFFYVAGGMIVAAEILGRFVFYASHKRIGI